MKKFAILSFPGTNCENETVRAFKRNGMEADVVLWNDTSILNGTRTKEFDGYCIPGGFSFEDRGRSGIVAAQEPIMEVIKSEAEAGKVILGICNGAQILVEVGLIPGYQNHAVGMGLGWNEMIEKEKVIDTGFRNQWVYLKNVAKKGRSAFNDFEEILPISLANGEGRFVIPEELLRQLEANDQIVFKYCNRLGEVDERYPTTPNGSKKAIAAICNLAGNVMAIMPHSERDPRGVDELIFNSIKHYLNKEVKIENKNMGEKEEVLKLETMNVFDLEIYVQLIITDNTERTIEEALNRKGIKLNLKRYEFFGLTLAPDIEAKEALKNIIESGELVNFNKHLVYVRLNGSTYQLDSNMSLKENPMKLKNCLVTTNEKDFMGQAKKTSINAHAGEVVSSIKCGVMWQFQNATPDEIKKVVESKILHNPYSMSIYNV